MKKMSDTFSFLQGVILGFLIHWVVFTVYPTDWIIWFFVVVLVISFKLMNEVFQIDALNFNQGHCPDCKVAWKKIGETNIDIRIFRCPKCSRVIYSALGQENKENA